MQSAPVIEVQPVIPRAEDHAVWPWQAEPHQVWSLLGMLQHLAGNWLAIINGLDRLRWLLVVTLHGGDHALNEFYKHRDAILQMASDEIHVLPFSYSLRKQLVRVSGNLKGLQGPISPADSSLCVTLLDELGLNIQSELESQLFFVVPERHKSLFYEDGENRLGLRLAICSQTPRRN